MNLFSILKILLLVITTADPLDGHGPEGPRDDLHTSENSVSTKDSCSFCLLNTPALEFSVMNGAGAKDICSVKTVALFPVNPPPSLLSLSRVLLLAHYLYIEGLIKEGNLSQIFP